MNSEQKRDALKRVYPGIEWQQKVAAMTNAQVSAIYLRLKAQKKV